MKTLILFWLPFLSLFTSTRPPQSSKWIFVDPLNGKKSKETHQYTSNEVILPFVWVTFRRSTLDSMIAKGQEYESLKKIGQLEHPEYMVDGVLTFLPDSMRLFYSGTNTIKINKQKYTYQIFEIYPKLGMGGENIYELFYLEGLGFFGAIYVDVEYGKTKWKHYLLEDLTDKGGNSVINKTKLRTLKASVLSKRLGA